MADVITFPHLPMRTWWIRRLPCGGWRGEIVGAGVGGQCGEPFTLTTPATSSKFALNRRYQKHKRPGQSVKGGAA